MALLQFKIKTTDKQFRKEHEDYNGISVGKIYSLRRSMTNVTQSTRACTSYFLTSPFQVAQSLPAKLCSVGFAQPPFSTALASGISLDHRTASFGHL